VDEHGHADEAVRRRDPDFLRMLRSPGKGSKLAVPREPHQALQRVPALSGALLMMPRALFDRIGGWDAGYRLHAEDLDLCRRAREAGAVVAIANDLQVTHVRGVSSRSRPFFVEWHKHRAVALLPEVRGQAAFAAGARGGMGCDLGACADAGAAPAAQVVVEPSPRSAAWKGSSTHGVAPLAAPTVHSAGRIIRPMPIIQSLLDTDLYKFTMMQAVLHQHPGAQVQYRFKCRTPASTWPATSTRSTRRSTTCAACVSATRNWTTCVACAS
jgi:hypothetical protein